MTNTISDILGELARLHEAADPNRADNYIEWLRLDEAMHKHLPTLLRVVPALSRAADAARRGLKARDAIQQAPETREWIEPLLAIATEHDAAMEEMRAALADLDKAQGIA